MVSSQAVTEAVTEAVTDAMWKVEGIRSLAKEDRFTTIALGVSTFSRQRVGGQEQGGIEGGGEEVFLAGK